jgi:N-acetylmuramoyl-L-alanine amidase
MTYKIIKNWLTINTYSRPGSKLLGVKGIVIHWVANPNTTAKNNRDYFNNLPSINANNIKNGKKATYGSAHEVIGLDGEVILCIPKNEVAYHVGSNTYTARAKKWLGGYPNRYTYGIECTHLDWNGKMTKETYDTLVERVADLCVEFKLKAGIEGGVWLHQEVVGWKDCHRWFVNNNKEWHKFLNLVEKRRIEKLNLKKEVNIVAEKEQVVSQWAKDGWDWAKVKGITDGNRPKDNMTREEMVTMLYRYDKLKK